MTHDDYCIAVDVGTSRVAAATARVAPDGSVLAAPIPLGRHTDASPAVAFVTDDGDVLLGDAAERRGITAPERLIREFKRSMGDDVPFLVAGHELLPQQLFAEVVCSALDAAEEREGRPPAAVVLTHPVAWGHHRMGLIRDALTAAGVTQVETISEPEAAARHYTATHDLEPGQAVIVYDLGGGTFDLAALRKSDDGTLELAGTPSGIEQLGGADFDDAVVRHAIRASGITAEAALQNDEAARLALAQLRRECVEAKEALSFDAEATVPVLVPPNRTSIRLTRTEFEGMIAPELDRTVDALAALLDDAGVADDEVAAVLLVGGSSRIPIVTQALSDRFGFPIAVDADPKSSIALGACRWGLEAHRAAAQSGIGGAEQAAEQADDRGEQEAVIPAFLTAETEGEQGARRWYAAALIAGAVVIAGGMIFGGSMAAGTRVAGGGLAFAPAALDSAPHAGDAAATPPWLREPLTSERGAAALSSLASAEASSRPATAARSGQAQPTKKSASSPRGSTASAPRPIGGASTMPSWAVAAPAASGNAASPATPASPPVQAAADPLSSNPPAGQPTDPAPSGPPADPAPTDPAPVDPGPVDPAPVDPAPVDPGPVDPGPADPGPVDPAPADPPPAAPAPAAFMAAEPAADAPPAPAPLAASEPAPEPALP